MSAPLLEIAERARLAEANAQPGHPALDWHMPYRVDVPVLLAHIDGLTELARELAAAVEDDAECWCDTPIIRHSHEVCGRCALLAKARAAGLLDSEVQG